MYGGFGGLGGYGGMGGYGMGGTYAVAGVGGGWWGVGAIVTGTLILIAIGVIFVAGGGFF